MQATLYSRLLFYLFFIFLLFKETQLILWILYNKVWSFFFFFLALSPYVNKLRHCHVNFISH